MVDRTCVWALIRMTRLKLLKLMGVVVTGVLLGGLGEFLYTAAKAPDAAQSVTRLRKPEGFEISIYAKVPGARQMALGPEGTLFVGTRQPGGNVYAVIDRNKDGKGDEVKVVAKNLFVPNGVAVHDGALYIAEINRISKLDDIEKNLESPPAPQVVNDSYSRAGHHGWKYIAFGPDGWLYVPVGAPCNVCERKDDPRYASLTRIKPDGSGFEIYAKGIRNTVGFDWDPKTKDLWFTDNGRDMLGDDLPPDELNHAPKKGMNFGFPYRYGNNVPDPEFGAKAPAGVEFTPPARCLDPHVAALGMKFYTGKMFPAQYRHNIFFAEHGSWNRSHKIGYRVMRVVLDKGKPDKYEPFIDGFMAGEESWGRPVDVLVMPDGALLVSDDQSGTIYRVTYKGRP